jgi:hypothetical protein
MLAAESPVVAELRTTAEKIADDARQRQWLVAAAPQRRCSLRCCSPC